MSKPGLTSRYKEALVYCAVLHAGQTRKGKNTPYVAHLLSVSALVLETGGDEDEAIAGLLHDSLEDQPDKTSAEEIERRFGGRVLELIRSCTDTPPDYRGGSKPSWRQRKEAYLAHLLQAGEGALRVALADKLHNARELLADYRLIGEDVWERFNAKKEDQLWFYKSLVAAFKLKQVGAFGQQLNELERAVDELEQATGKKEYPWRR